jgi:hypothetical protein
MIMIYEYPKSISEAAKLLDKALPGWENKINISTLNMKNYEDCLLGQLYGGYNEGFKLLFNKIIFGSKTDEIFGDDVDKQLWITEIDTRKGFDFYTALRYMNEGKKVVYTPKISNKERVLFKKGRCVADSSNELGAIFDFVDYKFKLYNEITFSQVKIGQRFTLKRTGAKFQRIVRSNDLNVINLESFHGGRLLDSDEVTDITD